MPFSTGCRTKISLQPVVTNRHERSRIERLNFPGLVDALSARGNFIGLPNGSIRSIRVSFVHDGLERDSDTRKLHQTAASFSVGRFRRQLALEVHEVAAEQPVHALNAVREIGVSGRGNEVGLPSDGEVGLEAEQLAFCGPVELPLFRSGVTSIAVSNCACRRESGKHELVGHDFGLATSALAGRAHDVCGECDRFLPYLEVPDAGCHGGKMRRAASGARTIGLHTVRK